jgi:heme A synthase
MGVHRFAVAAALATFGLLIAGGLVSTTESGLACPDWPLCEGQYIPPMIDGKQFEHTHRLVASFVGVMTVGLGALLFKHRRKDRVLTRLGVAAVVLVVVQALLGALTVKLRLPAWVSSTHLATAMAFFCLMVTLAFLTRQRLHAPASGGSAPVSAGLTRGILAVAGLTYAQVVAGAVMRHTRSGLVCGYDFPLCLGAVWPLDGHLGVQIHMVHRVGGVLVGLAVLWLAARLWREGGSRRPLRGMAVALAVGVVGQVSLGIATIWMSRDMTVMTVHSSLGAALLAGLVSCHWLARPSRAPALLVAPPSEGAPHDPSLEPA